MYRLRKSAPTGWRRPIGCLKLQVISHQRATNYRALLRKMTHKDKASNGSSPPYTRCHTMTRNFRCKRMSSFPRSNRRFFWFLHSLSLAFGKRTLIIGLFCGKWPIKIRHPMNLRHIIDDDVPKKKKYPAFVTICIWKKNSRHRNSNLNSRS